MVGITLLSLSSAPIPAALADWQSVAPADAGFAPDLAEHERRAGGSFGPAHAAA